MPFWSAQLQQLEPKRSYRFIVPFPVYVPKRKYIGGNIIPDKSRSVISEVLKLGKEGNIDPAALNLTNEYGKNKYFDFLAMSCTKPSLKTDIFKVTPGGAASHPVIRPGQVNTYEFGSVKIELIDTYDYDLASTLTAYLYAYGQIKSADVLGKSIGTEEAASIAPMWTPGKLVKIHNTSTPNEFHIIELLDDAPIKHPQMTGPRPGVPSNIQRRHNRQARQNFLGGTPGARNAMADLQTRVIVAGRARKWILKNPYIASIDFGSYNYGAEELSKVTIEIVYDRFDYDFVFHRSYADIRAPDADDEARFMRGPMAGKLKDPLGARAREVSRAGGLKKYTEQQRSRKALTNEPSAAPLTDEPK